MLLREFKNLRRKRERLLGFSDLLNYAALVDPGVILLKDGSLLAGWRYTGPDLNSAGAEELTALSHQVNSALAALGDGWAMNVDLIRHPSAGYPGRGAFPDPVTALIDEERRRHHTAEGRHFERTLTWTPPTEMQSRAAGLLFESTARGRNWQQTLEFFKRSLAEYEDALSARLALARMDDATLLAHLNACITGRREPIRPPEDGSYLDVLLGCHEFHAGFRPMLDDFHIRPISVAGFPLASWPEVTAFLDELAIPYRWSTRFIFLDPAEAERALKIQRRNWFQKRHGLGGMIKQVFSNGAARSFENRDAVAMAHDADEALAEASSCRVRFGYYTSAIVVADEDAAAADANAREIAKQLQHHGFPALIEHVNANTMVVLQIETKRALDAREELLAVPGIDAVMIGPADLSISLGVPGDFQNPKMVDAMSAIRDSCDRRKIAPGTQTRTFELARFWKERGMRFLGCSNEVSMMLDRGKELTAGIMK